jgi:hypothetical protein
MDDLREEIERLAAFALEDFGTEAPTAQVGAPWSVWLHAMSLNLPRSMPAMS